MPVCPKCKTIIDYLIVDRVSRGTLKYVDDEPYYEFVDDTYGAERIFFRFLCPNCGCVLFSNFRDAEDWLSQPTKPRKVVSAGERQVRT